MLEDVMIDRMWEIIDDCIDISVWKSILPPYQEEIKDVMRSKYGEETLLKIVRTVENINIIAEQKKMEETRMIKCKKCKKDMSNERIYYIHTGGMSCHYHDSSPYCFECYSGGQINKKEEALIDKLSQYAPSYLVPYIKSKAEAKRDQIEKACIEAFSTKYPFPEGDFDRREWRLQLKRYVNDCYREAGVYDERTDDPRLDY